MAEPDISKHFTCFLCNGQITVLGFVELEETCMRLGCANGLQLELTHYSHVVSVCDEEPPTEHSLFLNMSARAVYVSHLLRKDKLLKYFKGLKLFRDDITLPAEAMGFVSGEMLRRSAHTSELFSEPPDSKTLEGRLKLLQRTSEDTHSSPPLSSSSSSSSSSQSGAPLSRSASLGDSWRQSSKKQDCSHQQPAHRS